MDSFNQTDQKILEELRLLFDFVPPKELSRNIRYLFFMHLGANDEAFPVNFPELSGNVYLLLKFLEVAEDG